jgi:hypothetical protein
MTMFEIKMRAAGAVGGARVAREGAGAKATLACVALAAMIAACTLRAPTEPDPLTRALAAKPAMSPPAPKLSIAIPPAGFDMGPPTAKSDPWPYLGPVCGADYAPKGPEADAQWKQFQRFVAKAERDRQASAPKADAPREWYLFGNGMAPSAEQSQALLSMPLITSDPKRGLSGLLRSLIDEHEKAKPEGWNALVDIVKAAKDDGGELAMARAADALINEVPYVDNTGGVYFTPKRMFLRGGAVCKDFVTVKYLLLRDAGFPVERMRVLGFAPSAHSNYPEGHVALALTIEGEREPYVLDLAPYGALDAALKEEGQTLQGRLAELRKNGLQPREPRPKLSNMVPLSRFGATAYGARRPLLSANNELGDRFFVTSLPSPLPSAGAVLWTADDSTSLAFKTASGQVWVQGWATQGGRTFRVYKRMGEEQAMREYELAQKRRDAAAQEAPKA